MAQRKSASSVIAEARARLKDSIDADGSNRADAVEDLEFADGDQWPDEIALARKLDRRPCLTINKTDTFIRSTVNNMRQQRPRIQVHPVADGADEQRAKIIQGLIKHIEVSSNAEHAYDTAADFQVRMGWGYIRVSTKYTADDSFDQDICIEAIENPFTVYFDPSSMAPDGSDAEWCIITQRMKTEAFKREYPNAKVVSLNDLGTGDDVAQWGNNVEVVVAEYYRIEYTPETLILFSNGQQVFESDVPPDHALEHAGIYPVKTRKSMRRTVKWSKFTVLEELASRDLPGKHIPVVPVYGARLNKNGRVVKHGMVRHLKDPQRMYNFWRTSETEIVALAPKAPWVMAEGQDEGREAEWNQANSKNYSSLKYKPVTVTTSQGEVPLPAPERIQPQAIPAASVQAAMSASEDMKAVAGMFDPALGAEGNETSGTMVAQRQQQSDLSNFHFYDNLTQSIRWVGKIALEWIPVYYDAERTVRIIGEDGKPKSVTINQESTADGIYKVLHDVTVGTYDVVMETGPGYQTKREEAFVWMLEMGKAFPPLFEAAGDLIMRQSDNPGASDIADRLASVNPVAQATQNLPEDLDPKAKTALVQLIGQLQQAKKQIQQLTMEKEAKVFGVQEREQAVTEREAMKQQAEHERTQATETAETLRAHLDAATRLRETAMKDDTSLRETLIDAHTNLAIAHKQAQSRGQPNANRTTS